MYQEAFYRMNYDQRARFLKGEISDDELKELGIILADDSDS